MAKTRKKTAKAPKKKTGRTKRRVARKKAPTAPRAAAVGPKTARAPMTTALAEAAASKPVAVNIAVTRRLEADRRWPPYDLTKVMGGTDYKYDAETMGNFLLAVHKILAAGVPPYTFQYEAQFVITALGLTAPALMAAVNSNTTA
jgi:hypothetical protein